MTTTNKTTNIKRIETPLSQPHQIVATSILLTILDVDGGKAPGVVKFENLTTTKALLQGSRSSCPRG
jgi:hypothetical protein